MVPRFSIALIAKNEEKTLPRLLNSLKEFRDLGGEILLLDTGSTDNTAQVARDFGCKVHEVQDKFVKVITDADEINKRFIHPSEDVVIRNGDRLFDFASARNYIATFASNDVLATPDCDEIYTKLDLEKINQVILTGAEQLEYNFVFSHDEYGNESVKFMHCKFYNRNKLKWTGIIHEVLTGEANRVYLDESIIKLEHFQNHGTNRAGYLRGLALDCYNNPLNDRNSHYLARELLWNNRPKSAIQEFERHINMNGWNSERAQSMIYIGDAYGILGDQEKQVSYYYKAFHTDSTRREALIKLAYVYKGMNNPLACIAVISAALQIPYAPYYGNDGSHYTYLPFEFLYWSNGWLGNINEAKKYLDICLEYKPLDSVYLRDYKYYNKLPSVSFVIPQLGRNEGLKRCITSIKNLNYPQELIQILIDDGEDTVPVKVNKLTLESKGDYIVYASNDCEFTSDSLILAVIESIKYNKALIAFDTGVRNNEGYICEHFLLDKNILRFLDNQVFDEEFHHVGVDDYLWKRCKKMNQCMISKGKVNHYHFSRIGSGVLKDDVIIKGWAYAESDRELLKKKLKILNGD